MLSESVFTFVKIKWYPSGISWNCESTGFYFRCRRGWERRWPKKRSASRRRRWKGVTFRQLNNSMTLHFGTLYKIVKYDCCKLDVVVHWSFIWIHYSLTYWLADCYPIEMVVYYLLLPLSTLVSQFLLICKKKWKLKIKKSHKTFKFSFWFLNVFNGFSSLFSIEKGRIVSNDIVEWVVIC